MKGIQCEATTSPTYYWDPDKIEFPQCSHGASIEIDGVKLCLMHAGKLAVMKLLASGVAKKIKDTPAMCSLTGDKWSNRIISK